MMEKKSSSKKQLFHYLTLVALAIAILLADLLSKYWTHTNLPLLSYSSMEYPYGGIALFHNFFGINFSLNHATNKGAAWGIFAQFQYALVFLRLILIASLLVYLFLYNEKRSWQLPLVLIITGAIGNILDFFLYGHVIDMLHFVLWGYVFPTFNISDSAIFLGIVSLICLTYKGDSCHGRNI